MQQIAMRTSLTAMMAISVLFVGVFAISESAQQAETNVTTEAQNSSYQLGVDVFGGLASAGTGIVWFGIAAVVVVALGFLVFAGASGGR